MSIILDSESNGSDTGDEKTFINKLLGEMKNQFNKTDRKIDLSEEDVTKIDEEVNEKDNGICAAEEVEVVAPVLQEINEDMSEKRLEDNSESDNKVCSDEAEILNENVEEKPRIVMKFPKPSSKIHKHKPAVNYSNKKKLRSTSNALQGKIDESNLKRSSRRRSSESILQSAIARKEKSYNESIKPQRLTRQLKPTQKILDNLANAAALKLERTKIKSPKNTEKQKHFDDKNDCSADDKMQNKNNLNNDRLYKKHKYKQHNSKHKRNIKKLKSECMDYRKEESDSDSLQETKEEIPENKLNSKRNKANKDKMYRRSQRLSSSRMKEEEDVSIEEPCVLEPNTAEDESPFPADPECSSVGAELIASRLCLCVKPTHLYMMQENSEIFYCKAVDCVGDKLVGCNNILYEKEVPLFRTSTRVPFLCLCDVHKNRLYRHNCCPTCGVFCTQGSFVMCEKNHTYHRDCQICVGNLECCPHCGISTSQKDVHIIMECAKEPVLLPSQKPLFPSAKMTFQPKLFDESDQIKCESPPLIPAEVVEISNVGEMEVHDYDIDALLTSVKEESLEKLAVILGSRTVQLMTVIDESTGFTVLHYAVKRNLRAVVHMLIMAGMDVDTFDYEQNTPLMIAIHSFHNELAKYLIKVGAHISLKGTDGITALHLAAKHGNLKACQLLVEASVGIRDYINSVDDGGWTSLVWACEHGHIDVATYLISKGADHLLRDVEQNIALHWAAFSGSTKIIEMLLNMGSDIDAVNAHGDSPLHIGARQDNYNSVIVLLARGANIGIINKVGESPIDCTTTAGDCYKALSLNVHLKGLVSYDNKQKYILTNDISRGKETNPIQCVNIVDSEPKPIDFVYVSKNCFTTDVNVDLKITSLQACGCQDRCTSTCCSCGNNSIRCWYDEDGKLSPEFNYSDPPMIFECNEACACNAITCNNRVVQHGIMQRFQLFRTGSKGWGIRTIRNIPKGTYVCEYIGEIINDFEADQREDDSYLFDLDNRENDAYCIDARHYGNFARFINHSCNPNLIPIRLFIDHQDLRFPRIAFFANKDILNDEELSFDYGEKFWIIKYKTFTCECGSVNCKYSEDTISSTLANYNQRMLESNA